MSKDFKSYCKENKKILDENKEKADQYQKILDRYKDMDSNELMRNLFSEANKLKQEGKLDQTQLASMKSAISPFLNDEQRQMLDNIIRAINEQK